MNIPPNNLKRLTSPTTVTSPSLHTNRTPTSSRKAPTSRTPRPNLPTNHHPSNRLPGNLLIRSQQVLVRDTRRCRSRTRRRRRRCASSPVLQSASTTLRLPLITWRKLSGCSKPASIEVFCSIINFYRLYAIFMHNFCFLK